MKWNWQLSNWPQFIFDSNAVLQLEKEFLINVGKSAAFLKSITPQDRQQFIIEILTAEGSESSKIEAELLNRESLQSSIKKHFGLKDSNIKSSEKEIGMADLLCEIYDTFDKPLTHEMLCKWHSMLIGSSNKGIEVGQYRSHNEPMQIVSNRYNEGKVFFEAPPSKDVYREMNRFIQWFNQNKRLGSIFDRAAVCHVYFESIHPFEDGNGRIGRALIEKMLSQSIGNPILIAVSKILEKYKKDYYYQLGKCNQTLDIREWVEFFSKMILLAQKDSNELLFFVIEKAKLMSRLSSLLNQRQEKVLLRMFKEGVEGFKGGLSANNYMKITNTSRATATRDLSDLVEMGALFKTGQLRHTRYWLNIEKSS